MGQRGAQGSCNPAVQTCPTFSDPSPASQHGPDVCLKKHTHLLAGTLSRGIAPLAPVASAAVVGGAAAGASSSDALRGGQMDVMQAWGGAENSVAGP